MTSGYFEDFEVGDSRKAGPYLVSKAEIIQFARQYDPRPFHVDEEAAARSVFGGLTASAAHAFAIYIFLTNKVQPPHRALAGLGYDDLRQPNPVRPGDELDLKSTVLEKRESKVETRYGSSSQPNPPSATKNARRCCSASAVFSSLGDLMRKYRREALK